MAVQGDLFIYLWQFRENILMEMNIQLHNKKQTGPDNDFCKEDSNRTYLGLSFGVHFYSMRRIYVYTPFNYPTDIYFFFL